MTAGGVGDDRGFALGGLQNFEDVLTDEFFEFGGVGDHMAVDTLADPVQHLGSRLGADVGGDQRVFEFLQDVGVDFLPALHRVFELFHQPGARFLHARFQAVQQAGFLLHRGTEQSLKRHG